MDDMNVPLVGQWWEHRWYGPVKLIEPWANGWNVQVLRYENAVEWANAKNLIKQLPNDKAQGRRV